MANPLGASAVSIAQLDMGLRDVGFRLRTDLATAVPPTLNRRNLDPDQWVDNRSTRVDEYIRYAHRWTARLDDPNGLGPSWCGMFVYWCYGQAAGQARNPLPSAVFGGGDLVRWAHHHPSWIVWETPAAASATLAPGDIFVVTNHSHVGMVRSQPRPGDAFNSIEGNQTSPAHVGDWGIRGILSHQRSLNGCAIVIRPDC